MIYTCVKVPLVDIYTEINSGKFQQQKPEEEEPDVDGAPIEDIDGSPLNDVHEGLNGQGVATTPHIGQSTGISALLSGYQDASDEDIDGAPCKYS